MKRGDAQTGWYRVQGQSQGVRDRALSRTERDRQECASSHCVSPTEGRWQVRGWAYQFSHVPVSAAAPPRKATSSTPAPRMAPGLSFSAAGQRCGGKIARTR